MAEIRLWQPISWRARKTHVTRDVGGQACEMWRCGAIPTPDSRSSLQRFLGMINFYHRFLPTIASQLAPLHAASSGRGKELTWTTECQKAFKNAKAALAHATLLHHPKANAPTSITVDASDLAIAQWLLGTHRFLFPKIVVCRKEIQYIRQRTTGSVPGCTPLSAFRRRQALYLVHRPQAINIRIVQQC